MKVSKTGLAIVGVTLAIVACIFVLPARTANVLAATIPVFGGGCDSILFDQPIRATIPNGSIRCYGFEGSAGDIITIRMNRLSGDASPFIAVVSAGGTLALASDDDSDGDGTSLIAGFSLPQGGRYEILASANRGITGGEFELALARGAADQGSTQIRSCGGAIAPGQSLSGHLTAPGVACRYTFDAAAGDVINIAIRRIAGELDPFIEVEDPAGKKMVSSLNSSVGGSNAWITNYPLRNSGSHTIVVRSRQGQGLGPFELNLWKDKGCGGDLRPGQPVYAQITDSIPSCSYTLDAPTTPVTVTLVVERLTGNLQPVLQLRDPDGQVVAESGRAIQQRVEQAGTYLVTVSGTEGTSGAFRLLRPGLSYLLFLPPAVAPTGGGVISINSGIRFGYPIAGEVREPNKLPVEYSFNGSAGETVTILLERVTGSKLDPFLQLNDPGNVRVAYNDDSAGYPNSLITGYRLEKTGKYTIKAGAYRDRSAGQFYLTIWK